VVTGDSHLGRYYDRMPPSRLDQRRRRMRRGLAAAVEHALAQRAHFFLHLGDLFDTVDPRNVEREFVAHQLARLRAAGVTCLAIGGNHDTPRMKVDQGGYAPQGSFVPLGGLTLFEESRTLVPVVFDVPSDGPARPAGAGPAPAGVVRVAIAGLTPDPNLTPDCDPLDGAAWPVDDGVPQRGEEVRVLLLHQSVEGHVFPGPSEPIIPTASLAGVGTDVCFLGHIHAPAQFTAGRTAVVAPGATERMSFGDSEHTGFVYAELDIAGLAHVQRIPVPSQPRVEITVQAQDLESSPMEPVEYLAQRIDAVADEDAFVRLRLEGPVSRLQYQSLQLREVSAYGAARCFFFDLDPHGLYLDGQEAVARGPRRLTQQEEIRLYIEEVVGKLGPDGPETPYERGLWYATERALLAHYASATADGAAE
jgi:predicted phosphodiesterase